MRTVSDIIEGCDYANGGTVEIEWADWQTLKTAVLAQQTPNSDYAAAMKAILSSYFGRIPQMTMDNIMVNVQHLNAKHFA